MLPAPFKIGKLTVRNPAILAPMAGYTDCAFRSLCAEHHCGLALTEMTNAMGVTRHHKKTLHFLETRDDEGCVGAHLYGSDPVIMARAAILAESLNRFDFVDINAGCPVPKIMARGDGAGLLRDLKIMGSVIRAVREAIRLPLTVKTRIGVNPRHVFAEDVARCVEDHGADALFLHTRCASVRHAGPADWDALARVKSLLTIPVIGNGGIDHAPDALRMIEQTGVDGVMIGRAAIGNPWIFDEIRCLWTRRTYHPPTPKERRATILEHVTRMLRLTELEHLFRKYSRYPAETAACMQFRSHLVRYLHGFTGFRGITPHLNNLETISGMMDLVDQVLATPMKT